MIKYLNLAIGVKARLAALKASSEKLNSRSAASCMYTWRDIRHVNFKTNDVGLHAGLNGNTKIAYSHGGASFPREIFADESLAVRIDHTGWFADDYGENTIRGLIVRLPHGRFLAGYVVSDSGERVYYYDVYTDERKAAYAADKYAENCADDERQYQARYVEAQTLRDDIDSAIDRLRECLALRNNACFENLRKEAKRLISEIKRLRETLKTDYVDVQF